MFKANWNGKIIFSFDIKNIYGYKDYSIEKKFRDAGYNRELKCVECGDDVILKSGDKKVPHFAHISRNHTCEIQSNEKFESEEHKLGIQKLFSFFRSKVEIDLIDINYRFGFGRRANIYIENKDSKIAIEYVVNPMNYNEWGNKHKDYLDNNIIPLWVLSRKKFTEMSGKDYNFFEKTVEITNSVGILFTLDTTNDRIYFAKFLDYFKENVVFQRKIYKEYFLISEVEYDVNNGFSSCEFLERYQEEKNKFNEKCDKKYSEMLKNQNESNKKVEEKNRINQMESIKSEKRKNINRVKAKNYSKNLGSANSLSREEKWAYCINCGKYTNEWWYFEPPNKCKCYCTMKKGRNLKDEKK